jgi:hypothetical protein
MSGDCQREMTLDEWVERLPEMHSARKEYAALKAKVEKFTSTNTGSLKFFCCLGKQHPCQLNVNDGFCAAEECQYRVAEKLQAGA